MVDAGIPEMPDGVSDLERRLRGLFRDAGPNSGHRERLEERILNARATRVARQPKLRWRATAAGTLWGAPRRLRSVPVAAAVLIAVGLTLVWLNGPGSLDVAQPAWALEQSIAALKSVRTVYMSGTDATGGQFECWIRPSGAGEDLDRLRYESRDVIAVVCDGTVRAYFPRRQAAEILESQYTPVLRAWYLVLELRPWVGDTLLTELKTRAADWQESCGRDGQGRDCAFVQCSSPALGISFWFTFDARTKLVLQAKQWRNLTHDGDPAFDIRRVVYDQDMPEERFVLDVPAGARVFESRAAGDERALLDRAEALFKERKYTEAMAVYERVHEQYPDWNYAEHALMMIGICYDHMGQHDAAVRYLEQAIREYPDLRGWSETTYFYLGSEYAQQGDAAQALATLRKCVELCRGVRDPQGFPWAEAQAAILKIEAAAQQ